MKRAIYPGSFNPWHDGHEDILKKALCIFDFIVIAKGKNISKDFIPWGKKEEEYLRNKFNFKIGFVTFEGLLAEYIRKQNSNSEILSGIVRGLRNGHDLQYEMNIQYWNEDLGLQIPVVYFITDRKLSHISSSAIREIEKFKK